MAAIDPNILLEEAKCYACLGVSLSDALELALLSRIASGGTAPSLTLNVQEFSASGATNWTKPAGAVAVYAKVIGAGGGGGGGRRGGGTTHGGCGGAGGGLNFGFIPASSAGATEVVTIGAGGTSGPGRNTTDGDGSAGGDGGPSSMGTLIVAGGGAGGAGGIANPTLTPRPAVGGTGQVIGGSGGYHYTTSDLTSPNLFGKSTITVASAIDGRPPAGREAEAPGEGLDQSMPFWRQVRALEEQLLQMLPTQMARQDSPTLPRWAAAGMAGLRELPVRWQRW